MAFALFLQLLIFVGASALSYHLLLTNWAKVKGLKPKHSIQLGIITVLAQEAASFLSAGTIIIFALYAAVIVGMGALIRFWFSLTPAQGFGVSAGSFVAAWLFSALAFYVLAVAI